MTAIWQESPAPAHEWTILEPTGFPDEKRLHDLVAAAPQLLPLSGHLDSSSWAAKCFLAVGMRTYLPSNQTAARSSSR